jgi:hypothetical protein
MHTDWLETPASVHIVLRERSQVEAKAVSVTSGAESESVGL